MFTQKNEISKEEEDTLKKYDLNEFLFPYKKVKG